MKRIHWALVGTALMGAVVLLAYMGPEARWPRAVMDLDRTLKQTGKAIDDRQWDEAMARTQLAARQWDTVQRILWLNTEPSQMTSFSRQLRRLQAAVELKDPVAARLEFVDLYDIWLSLLSW